MRKFLFHTPSLVVALMGIFLGFHRHGQSQSYYLEGNEWWFTIPQGGLVGPQMYFISDYLNEVTIEYPFGSTAYGNSYTVATPAGVGVPIPIDAAYATTIGNRNVVQDKGVHILSCEPGFLFFIDPSSATSDATHLIPVSSMGNYYVVTGMAETASEPQRNSGWSEFIMVATEDNTQITVYDRDTTSTGRAEIPDTVQLTLNRGQTYRYSTYFINLIGDTTGLTGSEVFSNKPLAVFGTTYASICSGGADAIIAQTPPYNLWGDRFVAVQSYPRLAASAKNQNQCYGSSADYIEIVSGANPATVTVTGTSITTYNMASFDRVVHSVPVGSVSCSPFLYTDNGESNVIITSDQPVMVHQYLQGWGADQPGPAPGLGDPAVITVFPESTWQPGWIVAAPAASTANPNNFLTIMVNDQGTARSSITMNGNPIGNPAGDWICFPSADPTSNYKYRNLSVAGGATYRFQGDSAFMVYTGGTGSASSYAFAGGAIMHQSVDTVTLTAQSDTVCAGQPSALSAGITGGTAPYTGFAWSGQDGLLSAQRNTTHVYGAPGYYRARFTAADANGAVGWNECGDPYVEEIVRVAPEPVLQLPDDTTICRGDSILIGPVLPADSAEKIFSSGFVNLAIPDNTPAGVGQNIVVSGVEPTTLGPGMLASVWIEIDHPFTPDLDITLTSPAGTTITLSQDNNDSVCVCKKGYHQTCFTDTAIVSVADARSPFTGFFLPEQALATFTGEPVNGNWTLNVADDNPGSVGQLVEWSLHFFIADPWNYTWWPAAGLSDVSIAYPTAFPDQTTTYYLMREMNGCTITDSITIGVWADDPSFHYPATDFCTSTPLVQAVIDSGFTGVFNATPAGLVFTNPATGEWDPAQSDPGAYSITFTTDGSCPEDSTVSVVLHEPALSFDTTHATCGMNDGQSCVTASGGTGPYTYQWDDPGAQTTVCANNLTSGWYRVVVRDAVNCVATDSVEVYDLPITPVDAGNDTILCGDTLPLQASGTTVFGLWTAQPSSGVTFDNPGNANTVVRVAERKAYVFYWTVDYNNGVCYDRDSILVDFSGVQGADAGDPIVTCVPTGELLATHGSGVGQWTAPGGATVDNPLDSAAGFGLDDGPGTYYFYWTVTNTTGCSYTDSVEVQYVAMPRPDAGADADTCGRRFVLDANPSVPNGRWEAPTGVLIDDSANPGAIAEVNAEGGYDLVWIETVAGGCEASDTVHIDFTIMDKPFAGDDTGHCSDSGQLQAVPVRAGAGSWRALENDIVVDNINDPNSAYQINNAPGMFSLVWEETFNGCSASDTVAIEAWRTPILDFAFPDTVCACDSATIIGEVRQADRPVNIRFDNGWVWTGVTDSDSALLPVCSDTAIAVVRIEYGAAPYCSTTTGKTIPVTARQSPRISGTQLICNSSNTAFQINVDVVDGDTGSYQVTGLTGSWNGTLFTSAWIPSPGGYQLTLTDRFNCAPVTVTGAHSCVCITDAGDPLTPDTLVACEGNSVLFPHNGQERLDGNDTLDFVLHNGKQDSIGTVWLRNNTGQFIYQAPLLFNRVYYVHAVAGDDQNTDGQPDTAGTCADTSAGVPVVFRQVPGMDVQLIPKDSICKGDAVQAVMNITGGVGPYSVRYDQTERSPVQSGDYLSLSPDQTESLYFVNISDAYCTGLVDTTVTVYVSPPMQLTDVDTVWISCVGESDGELHPQISGGFMPFSYSWTDDSGEEMATTLSVDNLAAGSYTLTVTDAAGCSFTQTFTLYEPPLYGFSFLDVLKETCFRDSSGVLLAQAEDGRLYQIQNVRPWQDSGTFVQMHYLPGTQTLVISVRNSQGCQADSSVQIDGLWPITIDHSADRWLCPGDSPELYARAEGGNGAFRYYWNNGTYIDSGGTDTSRFRVQPDVTTTYDVYAVDHKGCPSIREEVTLILPAPLQQQLTGRDSLCWNEEGQWQVNAVGGTGALDHRWEIPKGTLRATGTGFTWTPLQSDTLWVTTTDTCGTTVADSMAIVVAPELVPRFNRLSDSLVCAPGQLQVEQTTVGEWVDCQWRLNNIPVVSSCDTLSVAELPAGSYNIALELTDPVGCRYGMEKPEQLQVLPSANARFNYTPGEITTLLPQVHVQNHSVNASQYVWTLDQQEISEQVNPSLLLPSDPGTYSLCLQAVNPWGCPDSTCRLIRVREKVGVYIPDAFTPDGDGLNDVFRPEISALERVESYELQVFNRWGEQIFVSPDPRIGWDGTYRSQSAMPGIYQFRLRFRIAGQAREEEYFGKVALIR